MKTFKRQLTAAGLLLFAILIMPVTASAENMYLTHGNDYEYTIDGDSFFPVVWDIRGAWMNYLGYARYYRNWEDPRAFDYADRELSGVLLQAKNAGVNSVIVRESLGADVRNQNNYYFPGRANMIRDLGINLIPGSFTPAGAVWGYFWSGIHPNRRSGFREKVGFKPYTTTMYKEMR